VQVDKPDDKPADAMDVDEPAPAVEAPPAPQEEQASSQTAEEPKSSQTDESKASQDVKESPKKRAKTLPKVTKRPPGVSTPGSAAASPASVAGTPQAQMRKPKPAPKAAPRTSLLASTLSKLSSQPDKPVVKQAERPRVGAWTDDFSLTWVTHRVRANPSAEQEQQHAASLVQRTHAAAERTRAAEYPLKMQAAKDAYRADHAMNANRRVIKVPGAMGINTTGLPSLMVRAVLDGNINHYEAKK
jgi:hypothetical protein